MNLRFIYLIIVFLPNFGTGQNIFQSGELFGLEFEGETIYNADYNEIIFKDYFIYGRKGKYLHILSENKEHHKKAYKKFLFHLSSELLIVGITADNTMDLISEDGSHYFMQEGNYDRVELSEEYTDTPDRDVLLVSNAVSSADQSYTADDVSRSVILTTIFPSVSGENVQLTTSNGLALKPARVLVKLTTSPTCN